MTNFTRIDYRGTWDRSFFLVSSFVRIFVAAPINSWNYTVFLETTRTIVISTITEIRVALKKKKKKNVREKKQPADERRGVRFDQVREGR